MRISDRATQKTGRLRLLRSLLGLVRNSLHFISFRQSSARRDANKANLICFYAMLGSGGDPHLSATEECAHLQLNGILEAPGVDVVVSDNTNDVCEMAKPLVYGDCQSYNQPTKSWKPCRAFLVLFWRSKRESARESGNHLRLNSKALVFAGVMV